MNAIQKERQRHHVSLAFAIEGIKFAFLTQPNFAYHLFFSLVAVLLGIFLKIGRFEWLVILLTIIMGIVVEMANTAIEFVVDLATDSWHADAKRAKDIAAGMMLIYSYGSVVIAGAIFFPYLASLFGIHHLNLLSFNFYF